MRQRLFPPAAELVWMRVPIAAPDEVRLGHYRQLPLQEQRIVADSVIGRRAEFGDARWCAHHALARFGVPPRFPILRGAGGMPMWPRGLCGAITHTSGMRAAVVARKRDIASVGLDIERATPLSEGVVREISLPSERDRMRRLAEKVTAPAALLFSAKEAVYKAWFPLTHRWLDFDEAEIDLRLDGTLVAYPLVRPTPVDLIRGQWREVDGYVMVSTYVSYRRPY